MDRRFFRTVERETVRSTVTGTVEAERRPVDVSRTVADVVVDELYVLRFIIFSQLKLLPVLVVTSKLTLFPT